MAPASPSPIIAAGGRALLSIDFTQPRSAPSDAHFSMRMRFDQFSKRIVAACLAQSGAVETERETSQEPSTVDVWFEPHAVPPPAAQALQSVPVLRAIARQAALIEPFHQAPSLDEILRCVAKQLSVRQELLRANPTASLPTLWILSAGRPRTAMRQLRFFRMPRASPGVYAAAPGLRWRLVVLSELVRTRGTLILRLLGAGRTFCDALDDLQRLPRHAWEAQLAIPWLVRYQFDIRALDPEERTPEEEAIMAAQKFEEWEREVFERGKTLGIDEGRTLGIDEGRTLGIDEGIAAVCERRLRRQLTDDERANVAARRKALGSTRLAEVVLDLSTDELARWIADPDAR